MIVDAIGPCVCIKKSGTSVTNGEANLRGMFMGLMKEPLRNQPSALTV